MADTSFLLTGPYVYGYAAIGLLPLLYWWALPRPIPGLPYNKAAFRSLLGDLPSMIDNLKRTNNFFEWVKEQSDHFQSPVFQVQISPLSGPAVVVADFREAQDIQLRRTPRDFDRSLYFKGIFGGYMPLSTLCQHTTDEFKAQRRLFQETMSPGFLRDVAAPAIHASFSSLIGLWVLKARLTEGRPFNARDDLAYTFLDAIWAVTFGSQLGTCDAQVKLLSSLDKLDLSRKLDEAVKIPHTDDIRVFKAFETITDTSGPMISSPFPTIHHFILRQYPKYKAAEKLTNDLVWKMIRESRERQAAGEASTTKPESATDVVFRRQVTAIEKTGDTISEATLKDELFTFLVAGHETSSTTTGWGLKLLADHPDAQRNLRNALRAALPTTSHSDLPSAADITAAHIPLLDATIEEIFRVGQVVPGNSRYAVRDTEIFGHVIPKGTEIVLLHCGPSYLQLPLQVDEESRSSSSRGAKDKVRYWDADGLTRFTPERWLSEDADGKVVFDPHAGPVMPFGAGLRGCFGKKLAYVQLRMLFTLILLSFELESVPAGLNSYTGNMKVTRIPDQCYVRLKAL